MFYKVISLSSFTNDIDFKLFSLSNFSLLPSWFVSKADKRLIFNCCLHRQNNNKPERNELTRVVWLLFACGMCSDGHCSPVARHWEQGSIGRYLIKTTVQLTAQLAEVIRSSLGTKASALTEFLWESRVSLFCQGPHNPTLVRIGVLV